MLNVWSDKRLNCIIYYCTILVLLSHASKIEYCTVIPECWTQMNAHLSSFTQDPVQDYMWCWTFSLSLKLFPTVLFLNFNVPWKHRLSMDCHFLCKKRRKWCVCHLRGIQDRCLNGSSAFSKTSCGCQECGECFFFFSLPFGIVHIRM